MQENINDVRLEEARIYAQLHEKYNTATYDSLSSEDKKEYDLYVEVSEKLDKERAWLKKK